MKVFCSTDKGLLRSNNQDAYANGMFDDGTVWAVVCDGMGGANGGNVASRMAVDYFSASLKSGYRSNMSENSVRNLLEASVGAANVRVFDKSRESSELAGMGTTIVAALITPVAAFFSHAGDSRAYILKNGELSQITRDHSIVQSMIESGRLSQEEARFHPRKNVITRALGVDETVNVDFTVAEFSKGDKILICTDGLTNFAETDAIKAILADEGVADPAVSLIELANTNGGGDNITAVVVENI